jgi:uncharacterized SAM-binding protein YcdF (DUF218 family)
LLFFAEKILWLFAAPSTLLLAMAVIGLLLQFGRHRVASMSCLSVSLGAFALIAILPIGAWMLAPLENRFPEVKTLPANITGIIVLGGATSPDITAARGMPSLNADAERMTTLVALSRQYPNAKLAFTGGNGTLIHSPMTEAVVAREIFTELGVDQSRVTYEDRSRTTYENALFLKALMKPLPGQQWVLITSAWHMPRAVGLFRRAGWPVLPYPVGYKTAPGVNGLHDGFPAKLGMVDQASHEWIGLVAYWLLGHTSALFPAP